MTKKIALDKITKAQRQRFWSKVRKAGAGKCHLWTGALSSGGYGNVAINGGWVSAHRLAYALSFGDPGEFHVMHTCDRPACCNKAHLALGTHRSNHADAAAKGRLRGRLSKGAATKKDVRVAHAVLTLLPDLNLKKAHTSLNMALGTAQLIRGRVKAGDVVKFRTVAEFRTVSE